MPQRKRKRAYVNRNGGHIGVDMVKNGPGSGVTPRRRGGNRLVEDKLWMVFVVHLVYN